MRAEKFSEYDGGHGKLTLTALQVRVLFHQILTSGVFSRTSARRFQLMDRFASGRGYPTPPTTAILPVVASFPSRGRTTQRWLGAFCECGSPLSRFPVPDGI